MKTDYEGLSFQVHQAGKSTRDLCQGTVGQYKGCRDGLDYYEAEITVTFNPGNEYTRTGEVALGESGEFWVATKPGRMVDCSKQVEWL